ncbi:MAG TPA: peptidoglycan DD-metalloendopeptidase family protein, partial [Saprospiraceae bacterium]|nr:peptidoglycan DD-metalloendopeptidase family protein [Saprospiraceae bacterium]
KNQDSLRSIGILPEVNDRSIITLLAWPLEQNNGLNDFGYHGIANNVDQDATYPDMILDYNCGSRTYDLASGYNHKGTDIFTWPFSWYKMEHDQVKVVAAAAGIIVYKSDGNFDRNCSFNSLDWNSVDIQHADGSIAWYGHMKNGSLTNKTVGESVEVGEFLGIVGSSGSSTAPHLHFEVYEPGGALIDPYAGPCNSLNSESWWIEQRPYFDSGLNALRTQSGPPVFPACPQLEIPNEKNQFCIGDGVYYAAYFRDQLAGQQVDYKVLRPNNSVYLQWDQTFDTFYPASYWYWYDAIPASASTGKWTFQATFLGGVFEKYFDVNGSTHIAASGNTTICEGEEITLTAPASQYGFLYQWKKNG